MNQRFSPSLKSRDLFPSDLLLVIDNTTKVRNTYAGFAMTFSTIEAGIGKQTHRIYSITSSDVYVVNRYEVLRKSKQKSLSFMNFQINSGFLKMNARCFQRRFKICRDVTLRSFTIWYYRMKLALFDDFFNKFIWSLLKKEYCDILLFDISRITDVVGNVMNYIYFIICT